MSKKAGKSKPPVETPEYLAMVRRLIRSGGKRVAVQGDEPDLAELARLRDEVDKALIVAVAGMRERGQSWTYIAAGLGTTQQAAQKRFAERVEWLRRFTDGVGGGPQAVAG